LKSLSTSSIGATYLSFIKCKESTKLQNYVPTFTPPHPTLPHLHTSHPHLCSIPPQPQLEKLGMTGLYPKTGITEENLKLYLQTPPAGLNSQLWEQSKKDNPDPQR